MWKLILKSDTKFVRKPDDPALGSWNPETKVVTINLSAIAKTAAMGGRRQNPQDIDLTADNMPSDHRLINLLLAVLNHEELHAALDPAIKQLTKDLARDFVQGGIDEGAIPEDTFTDPRGRARVEEIETVFYDAYYVILQEYAVRWVDGKHSSQIITELVGYVEKIFERFEKQLMLILEGLMSGELDEDHSRQFMMYVELQRDQVITRMNTNIADILGDIHGRMSWAVNTLDLPIRGAGLRIDEDEEEESS